MSEPGAIERKRAPPVRPPVRERVEELLGTGRVIAG
jgi:hypothetical protein